MGTSASLCTSLLFGVLTFASTARAADFAADIDEAAGTIVEAGEPQPAHGWLERPARVWQDLWAAGMRRVRAVDPEWLKRREDSAPTETSVAQGRGAVCIVLQEDRPDGTEMLTARYTLRDSGALRTYAGAGLNQAQYFHDADDGPGPTFFTRRNRGRSLGAAAEVGAELRVSERVLVSADVRWADLDERAEALRAESGPVGADPVVVGVGVGYRFR